MRFDDEIFEQIFAIVKIVYYPISQGINRYKACWGPTKHLSSLGAQSKDLLGFFMRCYHCRFADHNTFARNSNFGISRAQIYSNVVRKAAPEMIKWI